MTEITDGAFDHMDTLFMYLSASTAAALCVAVILGGL